MHAYRVVALPTAVAAAVRSTRVSPFGSHPTYLEKARGYGPCRHCLRDFEIGAENRILFTYDPFEGLANYPLPGPVFIHESDCQAFPHDNGLPSWVERRSVTLFAYGHDAIIRYHERVENGNAAAIIEQMLARDGVQYIQVRDTAAGCYDFRIEHEASASCHPPGQ
jgi:hypothetical protein